MQTQTHLVQGQAALLPSIILEKIFFFVEPHLLGAKARLPIHRHKLTQVCQSWREVALDRNGLWTTIDVRTDCTSIGQLAKGVGLVETLLTRTGGVLPLDVTVFGNPWSTNWPYPPPPTTTAATKSGPYDTECPHERVRLAAGSMYRYMRLLAPVRHRLRTLSLSFGFDRPAELAPRSRAAGRGTSTTCARWRRSMSHTPPSAPGERRAPSTYPRAATGCAGATSPAA